MKIKLLAVAYLALTTAGLSAQTPETIAKRGLPAEAMPFILDSHVYIQGVAMDTIPMSLIYDTGADRLYLDKDYVDMSTFGQLPLKKGKARMGGAGNDGVQTIPVIIDSIPLKIGSVDYKTPFPNIC